MNYGVFIVYPYTEKSLTRFGTGNPSPTVKYGKIKPTILNIRISAQIFCILLMISIIYSSKYRGNMPQSYLLLYFFAV